MNGRTARGTRTGEPRAAPHKRDPEVGVGFLTTELEVNQEVIAYIDAHRDRFGVEPICKALQFAPRTYWAAKARPVSARRVRDEVLKPEIVGSTRRTSACIEQAGQGLGAAQPRRTAGTRCTIERLMRAISDCGERCGGSRSAPRSLTDGARPRDRVVGTSAPALNRLWVADLTHVRTWSGFVYVAFITDVYSRAIVGWQVSRSLRSDLALDALEQALWRATRRQGPLDRDSSITRIAACSTSESATPSGSRRAGW